ncbi:MAG: DUF1801 domain-containing protein [Acidobacteria bacterium]|nr:MAG: DUF1801 domain-containing protein [Acidobacteriota bacterium]
MAEPKTKPRKVSVDKFLNTIKEPTRRADCFAISTLMEEATGEKPRMWGTSIVGFGSYWYTNTTGKPAEWPLIAFSPRKQNLTLYLMGVFDKREDLMNKLGKHSCTKGCLYIKRLDDVHLPTLKKLMRESVKYMKKTKTQD